MSHQNRINAYRCESCGGFTVTVDLHEGVTPFALDCRASGRAGDCAGVARSQFYRLAPGTPAPSWEWYRPDSHELRGLARHDPSTAEYVECGGLLLRKRGN